MSDPSTFDPVMMLVRRILGNSHCQPPLYWPPASISTLCREYRISERQLMHARRIYGYGLIFNRFARLVHYLAIVLLWLPKYIHLTLTI